MNLFRIAFHTLAFSSLLVLSQDLQVFPGVITSAVRLKGRLLKQPVPNGIESSFVQTADGRRLEVWRLPAETMTNQKSFVALVFHGNGGSLRNFLALQLFFQELGITSYGFDYRGFGRSSGWPSERGLELDSDAVWNYVLERERVDASKVIVLGFPSAALSRHLLILVSSFSAIKPVICDQRIFKPLAGFCWYELPTVRYVGELKTTNVILAHSEKDVSVRPYHAAVLEKAYKGTGNVIRLSTEYARHNATFCALRQELAESVSRVLSQPKSAGLIFAP